MTFFFYFLPTNQKLAADDDKFIMVYMDTPFKAQMKSFFMWLDKVYLVPVVYDITVDREMSAAEFEEKCRVVF